MNILATQGLPFLACLVMLGILGYIGIHVLKREIIFIDIALAQIAAVGAIIAHVVFHFHGHSIYATALAFGSTLVAAAFFAIVRRKIVQIPLEAVIGVTYAVSAAAALFLVGVAPGGHVHIHEMLAGSILWATWDDVLWSSAVFAAAGLCFYLFRKPFRAISEDYEHAAARGYNTLAWDFLFYALVGIVITMAVGIGGVVIVFTFLIIPATLSASFTAGWAGRLVAAWVAGAISAFLGLGFANRFDFSVGPAIALFLGGGLIVVGLMRTARVNRTTTAAISAVMAVVLGLWFGTGDAGRDVPGSGAAQGIRGFDAAPSAGEITHSHAHDPEPGHAQEGGGGTERIDISRETLAGITDARQLEEMYASAADAEEKSLIICRTLETSFKDGARLAIGFLETDPPLLFRMTVVEKLGETAGIEFEYAIDKGAGEEPNRSALDKLKREMGF